VLCSVLRGETFHAGSAVMSPRHPIRVAVSRPSEVCEADAGADAVVQSEAVAGECPTTTDRSARVDPKLNGSSRAASVRT